MYKKKCNGYYIYIYRNNNRSLVPFMIYGSTLQQNAANNS